MEEQRSLSLLQLLGNEGLLPSQAEEERRTNAVEKLNKIVSEWVRKVAWQRRLPKQEIAATSAAVLPYGSYGLGVHGSESDIDALCVGPSFATLGEDFFIVLRNMLGSCPDVCDIHCVKGAKVPLMRFRFDGISVDLPYARLQVLSVPRNFDVLDPLSFKNIDETSLKSFSGVQANKCILQLVPDLQKFQELLRCIKLWAKRRGVYGNLNGFLGGVHLAVLAAFVCQVYPTSSLSALVMNFFKTFALWPWHAPVVLQNGSTPAAVNQAETRMLMPVQLPCNPPEYCHSNITRSTFYKIRAEFLRGHQLTKGYLQQAFDWHNIFEPFPYGKTYAWFLRIYISASDQDELGDWAGWVKSRFPFLLVKLEEIQGLCDPNPTEYVDVNDGDPNAIFYWGLQASKTNFMDINSINQDFWENISGNYQGSLGRMKLSIVLASDLTKHGQFEAFGMKVRKACWKILDYNPPRNPVYSQHLPNYIVGYVAATAQADYASAGY